MAYIPNVQPGIKSLTFTYKSVQGHPIEVDIYPPTLGSRHRTIPKVPAVLYFHGGGLAVGDRASWFPSWLQKRACAAGFAFISADYRLMPPATGFDIIQDIQDLFRFLASEDATGLNSLLDSSVGIIGASPFHVDAQAIAVAGSSAGGQCVYYAAVHATPKPKCALSMYGMGGDYLTPQYLTEKTAPFFRGREMLNREDFAPYIHPAIESLPHISSSPLSYHPDTRYPTNERMFLSRLYLQLGIMLDYLTGEHAPGLSSKLEQALASDKLDLATLDYPYTPSQYAEFDSVNNRMKASIPERLLPAFSQFSVTSSWPPTYLVHGSNDSAVLAHESYHLHRLLTRAGVDAKLQIIEGQEHSFDYEPDAEGLHGKDVFDEVAMWIEQRLRE